MPASAHDRSSSACAFAWAGGAMFVASLVWFVYFYYNALGQRAAASDRLVPHLVFDALVFGLFALHHSIFAREGVKQRVKRLVAPDLERSLYVWIASILFIVVCVAWRPVPGGTLYELKSWSAWSARALQLCALLLAARAAGALDALELAGIRQACGPLTSSPLRIVGPYRWVRHPLYLGWMLFVFSAPEMTVDRLTFAAISSAYLLIAIPWEERSLLATLGDAYEEYKRIVRWRVVPYVY